jgi:catechol 2,3-dioxygenase-like lactoylglutathione lyase family enzyme
MNRAQCFYEALFKFEVMESDERFCAFRVGPDVVLLFTQGATDHPIPIGGGIIPPHNTIGPGHFVFAISPDELRTWREVLTERGIQIESEIGWERGGHSLYFRDSDGNLLELVTPGTWANY